MRCIEMGGSPSKRSFRARVDVEPESEPRPGRDPSAATDGNNGNGSKRLDNLESANAEVDRLLKANEKLTGELQGNERADLDNSLMTIALT